MARSGAVSVYLKETSPRSEWVFRLFIEDLLGGELHLVSDIAPDGTGGPPMINYSDTEIEGAMQILPHGILSEKDIRQQQIAVNSFEGLPVFFMTGGGDLPFDPFAMAFYLVSRYEEYLPFEYDRHKRFPSGEGLASRAGFLQLALVNRLAMLLKEKLQGKFPGAIFSPKAYDFIPTIDVDIAFAHLGKGFVRATGAMGKLILKGKMGEVKSRVSTMLGHSADPYDNFGMIRKICTLHNLRPRYFILAGDPGPYDRNLSVKNKRFARLLRELSDYADIGVHPSYGAGNDPERMEKEVNRIRSAIGKEISISRQHFVKLHFPDTYRALINAGIKEDYSMGFADCQGFRASIASPYYHFDLASEKETELRVFPFMFMDSSLEDYQGLSPEEYVNAVIPVINEVKHCNGTLVGIWHNYAMADDLAKHEAFSEIIKIAAPS
ncbi:MAG TPA: polysaccharide deacetylase family protein [Bacteroidales bacterium]|nr:polysaccharide deacetylase family protein [Bacteroidales bacterium]